MPLREQDSDLTRFVTTDTHFQWPVKVPRFVLWSTSLLSAVDEWRAAFFELADAALLP